MSEASRENISLKAESVRQWLEGQRAAQAVIEEERRHWLARLDEDTALRLYVALASLPGADRRQAGPSPVLVAIREATARRAAGGRRSV